ncbi:GD14604 [Drosophila simulans]|uniref:GD14604 n=1 Tax=Drosophila simulans TaxID=7240 RepID=B4QLV5_DROSI|nr:GD14604 [Drosophila simulans]
MSKWLLVKFWLTLPMICFCHVTFTNLNCSSYNLDFMSFPTCRIKAVNRTHKYISIYAKINQLPIVDARVSFGQIKPFLFDLSYDGCQFMKNQKNMFVKTFYKTFQRNTNMNHTCPYDHDIIVDKLFTGNLEEEFGRYIVIPNGDYAIYTDWATNKVARASVKIYLRILNK